VAAPRSRHGHDPFVYLRDVLARLPDHPKENTAKLLPDRWSPQKPFDPQSPENEPAT
jgi:hypothetical protein